MSRVEEIVATHLAGHPVERISDGYRYTLASGVTDLTFRPAAGPRGPFELSAIATVDTRYQSGMPNFTQYALAKLNRRSIFGSFYRGDDSVRSKLTFSIYTKEPAAEWVAELLLTAFGHQLACGIGIAQAELSDELLRANRANLEYPRTWERSVAPEELENCAARFRQAGFVSTVGPYGLVMEVPLAEGGKSRMIDPTSETALLHVSTAVRHPMAGVGYLGTIALPFNPIPQQLTQWCEYLNAQEHEQLDFVPRLGAWGVRGLNDEVVYALFWPTDQGAAGKLSNIANWLIQRTLWVKDAFWVPGVGLQRSMDEADG